MNDIVERLRAGICEDPCKVKDARSGCECAEAADEIERLRTGHINQAERCLPLAEVRRLFGEETKRAPTPPAPTREETIEAIACAHAALCGIDWDKQTVSGKMIWIHKNAEFYDALLAMGAIREPRTITGSPEGWGKRVEVTVLGDREEGSGIDQMNQIADRMAMKPRAD
jgi:hypothetical protein